MKLTRTEETPPGIKLPKSVLRWVALGLVVRSTIVVIVLLLVIGYTVVFLIPAMRGIPILPKGLFKLAALFIGNERATRLEFVVQKGTETFSLAASAILRRNALALILKALGLT